jgi:hypothetical protein
MHCGAEVAESAGASLGAIAHYFPNVPRAEWTRRFSVALDAMRGLALTLTIQPRTTPIQRDPLPDLRRELAGLLDR